MGLGLGAAYLAAGLGHQAADHQRAAQIAQAAVSGYDAAETQSAAAPVAGQAGYAPVSRTDAVKRERSAAKPGRGGDLDCLTQAVYYEARGESPQGQFAVAQVVMNRVKHPAFPKSVCGVVFQGAGRRTGCQFSFACDGSMRGRRESAAWTRARRVAARVLSGAAVAEVGAATHFHTTGVAPAWGPQMRRVAQVGMHVFYRFNPRRAVPAPAPALVEAAILISTPALPEPELQLTPAVLEKPAEAAVPPPPAADATPAEAKTAQPPAGKPAEAAALTAPQPASAGAS